MSMLLSSKPFLPILFPFWQSQIFWPWKLIFAILKSNFHTGKAWPEELWFGSYKKILLWSVRFTHRCLKWPYWKCKFFFCTDTTLPIWHPWELSSILLTVHYKVSIYWNSIYATTTKTYTTNLVPQNSWRPLHQISEIIAVCWKV